MRKISFVFLILGLCIYSCSDKISIRPEIEKINLDLEIVRFDSVFKVSSPSDLPKLKKDYSFMFKSNITDSLWILKMNDSLQNEIESEIAKEFKDFTLIEDEIELFFKHLKFYFPEVETPLVITLAEYVDYKSKVLLKDDLLFISLDNYLGKDHKFYGGFQEFISSLQDKNQILPDIAQLYSDRLVNFPERRDLIGLFIIEGKKLYFKETMLPQIDLHHLLGYSQEQLEWSKANEIFLWQYFVERDLLYKTDLDFRRRFILPGPFTKFYLEIDSETPPRLGQYLGWQIVRAYAKKHPDKGIKKIMNLDEAVLFAESNYKPN